VGWFALAPDGPATIEVVLAATGSGETVGPVNRIDLGPEPVAVRIPWSLQSRPVPLDLIVRQAEGSINPAFIAVHYPLDRRPLVNLCRGKGVELGPGPRPQIFPGEGVDVSYVEQTHPDDWGRLYGGSSEVNFDPALSDRYVVGNANDVPAEARSLDFIFSSHVFEHLANPLGHLEHWSGLLKSGGKIVAVIPDYIGSKDFLMEPTSIAELESEYASNNFDVTDAHYEAYGRARGDAKFGEELRRKSLSIHVHFYTHDNTAAICEWAVRNLGYSSFSIIHADNHKDFYLVLNKA